MTGHTAGKLIDGARDLIVRAGYNGFSYADLSERFGLRKPSIHHHFPSKVDLVVAVVEQARAGIAAQVAALQASATPGQEQLIGYIDYWEACITRETTPFCVAAILGAELPSLPPAVATAVSGHFADLARWLTRALTLAAEQNTARLPSTAAVEAEIFMGTVYGAMLTARAFDDPDRFRTLAEAALHRIGASSRPPEIRAKAVARPRARTKASG